MRDPKWPSVPLREVASDIKDGTHGTHPRVERGIPFLSAKNITPSGHLFWSDDDEFIDEAEYRSITAGFSPRRGDLLVTVVGSLGRTALFGEERVAFQRSVAFVRPNSRIQPEYLLQASKDVLFVRQMEQRSNATAQAGLYLGELGKVCIPLPHAEAQARIAEILSTVDDAIEQTEALIAKTQQIKAGLMHDLFTRGVTADGKLRPSREEAPQLYKESPLGWIPKEWEAGHLVDRRHPSRPHIKTGPFGSSLKLEHWVDEGVPVITIGALGEGEFIQDQLLFVSEETATRLSEYRLSEGDIVFSRVADVGRSAVITADEAGWVMSSNLMRISLDGTRVVAAFLQAQLAYDSRVRAQIRATVNAGGREVANSSILNRLHFSWPEADEQRRIVERLDALEARRRCLLEDHEKLRFQRTGLMHDLLTGRVPVVATADRNVEEVAASV